MCHGVEVNQFRVEIAYVKMGTTPLKCGISSAQVDYDENWKLPTSDSCPLIMLPKQSVHFCPGFPTLWF